MNFVQVQQAEFNHTVLHGQRLSVDFAHPTPLPTPRPAVVAKSNLLPPPASARPSSVMDAKPPPMYEPVKAHGAPLAHRRPASATPGGGHNRFVSTHLSQ